MATSPMHMDIPAQAPAPKAGKPPLTANPAFPWIVALWFAALLGIGSLVVPVALLERASEATGLASILPMAASPLGFTAQAIVALVGTVIGGVMGLFLARKIVAPKAAKSEKFLSRKVLNPAEDLGDDGIEGDNHDDLPAPATTGRRRALAIAEEDGPSDFLNVAPLPGVSDRAGKPVEEALDDAGEDLLEMSADMEEPALETANELEEPRQEFQPDPAPEPEDDEPLDLEESAAVIEAEPEDEPVPADEPAERQEFQAVATASTPVVDVEFAEPQAAKAPAREPLPFSPPSMARKDEGDSQQTYAPESETGPESEETVSDKQIFDAADAPADEAHEMPASEPQVFKPVFDAEDHAEEVATEQAEDTSEESGEEPGEGLVQLVQRLGSTIEKHREWSAEQAALKVAAATVAEEQVAEDCEPEAEAPAAEARIPGEFDPAAAEDAAQAMAAYFGSPVATAPAEEQAAPSFEGADEGEAPRQRYESFRGTIAAVGMDDEDEDEDDEIVDLAASFALPLKGQDMQEPEPAPRPAFDQPPPSAAPVAEDDVADEAEDDSEEAAAPAEFGSTNPFKRNAKEFVRIEEPEPDIDDAEPAVLFPNQEARKPVAPAARAFDRPAGDTGDAPKAPERPRPSNDDNERALREALLNLQRMGK